MDPIHEGRSPQPRGGPEAAGRPSLWDRLTRVTSGGRYMPEIDGVRFFSILLVVGVHLSLTVQRNARLAIGDDVASTNALAYLLAHGNIGVQLFFAISGFILGLPFVKQHADAGAPVSIAAYFKRRLLRLEPPYLLTLVLLFFANTTRGAEFAPKAQLPHLLASAGYLHNLVYGVRSTVNPVAWSLEIEFRFYVLAPVLALLYAAPARLRRALLVLLVAGSYGFGLLLRTVFAFEHLDLSIFGSLQFFAVGMLFAELYVTRWRGAPPASLWADAAGIIGAITLVAWSPSIPIPTVPVLTVAVAFVMWGALSGRLLRPLFRLRVFAVIGGMCYTIYLIHYPVIFALSRFTNRVTVGTGFTANFLVQAALLLPAVLGTSAVLFVLVERPCMQRDWHVRLWRRVFGTPQASLRDDQA